ncbi:MYPT75D CG6896PAlike [Caligus rogercresseyi]|uniref:MYPT75D CG6896PAlike n=1 Tax=Caligus rogercresseyi TaxID=217165 RepID=A0A7T8KFU7_CALRO|nr:MYPT75D CG6896PAlike [Caligus rogercresseyi]
MLELLLQNGANVNAKDTELWTPFMPRPLAYLIDREADLLAVNADGNMPYDLSEHTQAMIDDRRRGRSYSCWRTSRKTGTWSGGAPTGAANGYSLVLEYLLENDVSVDVVDTDLWQPIHAAACWGHLEAVELLAQNGANINALTKNGEKPSELTEDEDIKQNKSVSSRSQSIRRSSLREKMRTTKKDAQEEKIYLIKNYETLGTPRLKWYKENPPVILSITLKHMGIVEKD